MKKYKLGFNISEQNISEYSNYKSMRTRHHLSFNKRDENTGALRELWLKH